MADIFHHFVINAPVQKVFEGVSTPAGLDAWWTKHATGEAAEGKTYSLWFGPEFDWRAKVTCCVPYNEFELKLTQAHRDWQDTRVGFLLEPHNGATEVHFYHLGWPEPNDHYRISNYCWAMYLRLLKRHIEHGETVPYEQRLEV